MATPRRGSKAAVKPDKPKAPATATTSSSDLAALPDNLPPMAEEEVSSATTATAIAPRQQTYPVDFVAANNTYAGNSTYCLNLTDEQIRVLLRDDDSPRFVRIPDRYFSHNGNGEKRYLAMSNVAEIHVGGGWEAPDEWEWAGLLKRVAVLGEEV